MTLYDVLRVLRQRLVDAIDRDDRESLSELKTTFTLLKEASYESESKQLIRILVAMEDTARDGVMKMAVKGDIPSVDTIKSALS